MYPCRRKRRIRCTGITVWIFARSVIVSAAWLISMLSVFGSTSTNRSCSWMVDRSGSCKEGVGELSGSRRYNCKAERAQCQQQSIGSGCAADCVSTATLAPLDSSSSATSWPRLLGIYNPHDFPSRVVWCCACRSSRGTRLLSTIALISSAGCNDRPQALAPE
jgi:hypothetical protein